MKHASLSFSGLKFLCVMLIASAALATPAAARHLKHHKHARVYITHPATQFSYNHNYGPDDRPGARPGDVAFYDGTLRALCKQSAAAYRGQDGHVYPCF